MLPSSPPNELVYVCGSRSFSAVSPGRKISEVVACWRRLGFDVTHLCGGDVPPRGEAVHAYGDPGYFDKWYRKSRFLYPLVASISEARDIRHDRVLGHRIRNTVRSRRPRLIWERSSPLHANGLKIAKEFGLPYVLEWKDHLVAPGITLFHRQAVSIEDQKLRGADFVVVESAVLKGLLAQSGVDSARIIVAHNGVNVEEFEVAPSCGVQVRKEIGVGSEELLVGYVGSYAFYHDTPLLIQAAKLLAADPKAAVRVLLVGAGKDYERCRRLAERLGLSSSRLILHEPVPAANVPTVLNALDVAVLPGCTDIICPIKIMEYMAAGLPVLAPDYPCNREVIENSATGLLFRPRDANAIAAKVRELSADAYLRRRLGAAARQAIRRRFSWESTWGQALVDIAGRIPTRSLESPSAKEGSVVCP
jgi:glycosyltransferase involved in cell wall biosynthesis